MMRAALVTGASRGLGLNVAVELARRGYDCVGLGCSRNSDAAQESRRLVEGEGARARLLVGDLLEEGAAESIVHEFLDFSGSRLQLLVNNAGYFRASPLVRLSEEEWDRQIAINLSAPFRTMRASIDALSESGGSIVNVSSLCGFKGAHGAGPYSAAKAGLEALTRSAALELGERGIRINAVIPGFMLETDMGAASDPDYVKAVLELSPLRKTADVASVASAIADLVEMPAVTGQILSFESRVAQTNMPRFFAE